MTDTKYDALKLKGQLCFQLYAASRETIKLYKPYLDKIDLTYTQYIAMMVLWEKSCVTVKEMGELLFLDSGTLTPLLKKMEQKGLLTRTRSVTDERSLNIQITEKGERLKDEALHIPYEMAKCIQLDAEEALTLYKTLCKLLGKGEKE